MHTFFINTSKLNMGNYSDILEIQHETRRLVSLECPLSKWDDTEEGYKSCVQRMGEMIDNYKDINNDFNLVFFIDLLAYNEYTSIPMNGHRERYACLKALHAILTHYVNTTFVQELEECGRSPREVLLIFEENELPADADEQSEDGIAMIRRYTKAFLGMPDDAAISAILKENAGTDEVSIKLTREKIENITDSCIGKKVIGTYAREIDVLIKTAAQSSDTDLHIKEFLDLIINCSDKDNKKLSTIAFDTDRRSAAINRKENAQRNLRLCFYLLECVESGTVNNRANNQLGIKAFPDVDWEDVAARLNEKHAVYQRKYNEIKNIANNFTELKLAPPLYTLNHKRFALDEFGRRGMEYSVVDAETKKDEEQEAKDLEEGIVRPRSKKEIAEKELEARSFFAKEEYAPFDYYGDGFSVGDFGSKTNAEKYISEAQKLRQHHRDYLQRLKIHVFDGLSNYAGRSAENDPALLRQRKVSIALDDIEDEERDYRYATEDRKTETKTLKTVEDISEKAYASAILDYLEFCAGRSVAITDIDEQCNWFISRVHQIKESLMKIKQVALGLLFALIILYIPFVVLQWEAITKGVMAITVAMASVAVPLLLLYIVFVISSSFQRKKYHKAWNDFKRESDRVLEQNARAVEKYDQLLLVQIPILRYVYEYKLDVDFYADCCELAKAKILHHKQKLHDRINTTRNIIEDLELPEEVLQLEVAARKADDDIDYNVSFCSVKTNREIYSIVDTAFLEAVYHKGEANQ